MRAFSPNATSVRSFGFTLVEFMVTLVIMAILLGIGVPSFRTLIQNQRLTTTVNDLFAAINLARAEAVKRNGRVDLAPLDGQNWGNGWAVFVDSNLDQTPKTSDGDTIIFQANAVPQGITVASSFTDNTKPYIAYMATGRTRTNASLQQPQAGTITFAMGDVSCPQGTECRRIKINFLGRTRVCNPSSDATCTATASD